MSYLMDLDGNVYSCDPIDISEHIVEVDAIVGTRGFIEYADADLVNPVKDYSAYTTLYDQFVSGIDLKIQLSNDQSVKPVDPPEPSFQYVTINGFDYKVTNLAVFDASVMWDMLGGIEAIREILSNDPVIIINGVEYTNLIYRIVSDMGGECVHVEMGMHTDLEYIREGIIENQLQNSQRNNQQDSALIELDEYQTEYNESQDAALIELDTYQTEYNDSQDTALIEIDTYQTECNDAQDVALIELDERITELEELHVRITELEELVASLTNKAE